MQMRNMHMSKYANEGIDYPPLNEAIQSKNMQMREYHPLNEANQASAVIAYN